MPKISLLILILLLAVLGGCSAHKHAKGSQAVGDIAGDFTLPDQNGAAVTLSQVLETHNGAVIAFYPKDDSKN
ncbi:thioredoxin domain-containing protein [Desulfatibacillum aliphaticivorans]|uniref:redoxin domain-containing protein n=1 Tax=Desulfatibacillum aliphaticivorans TaxID=218208 RepID=UPI0001601EE3|nr:redoxin domain-containing protein [Desulfatibacillum aliphaticivorans]